MKELVTSMDEPSNLMLSMLAAVITTLIGVIVGLVLRGQSKFEVRMERHVQELREDMEFCTNQLMVLRTILMLQLPEELRRKVNDLTPMKGGN